MLTGQGYAQVFYDAIDRLASQLQSSIARQLQGTILLGVEDTPLHSGSCMSHALHLLAP